MPRTLEERAHGEHEEVTDHGHQARCEVRPGGLRGDQTRQGAGQGIRPAPDRQAQCAQAGTGPRSGTTGRLGDARVEGRPTGVGRVQR